MTEFEVDYGGKTVTFAAKRIPCVGERLKLHDLIDGVTGFHSFEVKWVYWWQEPHSNITKPRLGLTFLHQG